MTLLPPTRPPVRPAFYCYAIVDTRATPPSDTIDVRLTRAECRAIMDAHPDAVPGQREHPYLRARRCRATRYES